jgi:glutamine transport system substrate-binding protein
VIKFPGGRKQMKKLIVLVMTIMLAAGLAAGCGGTKSPEKKEAAPAKVLRVGTEPTFAPFEFQKKDSKDFDGFDMDLIRAVGQKMNMKVEIQNMGFDALIPALNAGNIDVAVAGISITEDRKKAVDFTDAYYESGLIVVVNKNDTSIKGVNDLKDKKIAVQIGTTGAEKAAKVPGAKVTTFNTNAEVFLELKNKGVDAVIIDKPVAAYYLVQGGKDSAKMVGEVMEAESYGMAFKKGNKLAAEANKALAELKKDGTYAKLYKQWFGEEPKAK